MNFIDIFLSFIFILCLFLVIYHHVGYPLLLKHIAKKNQTSPSPAASQTDIFPSITIIIPAYNEEKWIASKIRNCASIDYPREQLYIQVHCDGCTDKTAEVARETIQEMICADTFFEIFEHQENTGKVNVINRAMQQVKSELCVLSDTSALVSIDALTIAKYHFENNNVGVVNGKYIIFAAATEGEEIYWHYQNQLKGAEAKLATTMGSHGAFYIFRSALFQPLSATTINDDFVLPMRIVEKGYLSIYDGNVIATELEPTDIKDDFTRRVRISAGNMQQIILLAGLFKPKHKKIAFAFASGKGLRLLTPYLLIILFICCFLLRDQAIFASLFYIQLALYFFTIITFNKKIRFKPLQWFNYLLIGHTANFIGGLKYLITGHS